MIIGIGVDIVEIERIRALMLKYQDRFLKRVFSPAELEHCLARQDPAPGLSARFAAKEALVKALGTGMVAGMHFHDVEVKGSMPPTLTLRGKVLEIAEKMGMARVHVSLSHERLQAVAIVIMEV